MDLRVNCVAFECRMTEHVKTGDRSRRSLGRVYGGLGRWLLRHSTPETNPCPLLPSQKARVRTSTHELAIPIEILLAGEGRHLDRDRRQAV